MYLEDGVLSTEDCEVSGNTLGGVSYPEGAAFYTKNKAFLTILSTSILNNIGGSGSAGGAVSTYFCQGTWCDTYGAPQIYIADSTIRGNRAKWGGAIWLWGAPSRLSVFGTTLEDNLGSEYSNPSAVYIAAGSAVFGLGTHFKYSAAGDGINPSGGTLYYQLPGPAGHWLPNAMCKVRLTRSNHCHIPCTCATADSQWSDPVTPGLSGGLRHLRLR